MDSGTTAPHTDSQPEFLLRLNTATPRIVVTPALLALNAGVFLVLTALGIGILGGRPDEYLRFGANLAPLTSGGEWWRLIACTFVHIGILHLAVNMWALWASGQLVERLFGNVWFAALYLFAGAAGSVASMLWNPHAISAGASGAVFGVFGALLAYVTVLRGSIPAGTIDKLRFSIWVFVAYSVFRGFGQTGIDNAAHLGGLAGGFVMGMIAARPLHPRTRRVGNTRRTLLAALLATLALPTIALFEPDTARVYRQASALQLAVEEFSAEETRLNAALQRIAGEAREGKISDVAAARELRTSVLPAWDAAVARLARVNLDAGAPTRKDYELLMGYAVARREMMKMLADYLETGQPVPANRLADLRAQADEALKLYRERQKK